MSKLKVVAKPIDMIAVFTKDGIPTPVRFKYCEDDISTVIKVDRVILRETEKFAGNNMVIFRCQSTIGDMQKIYELKYELATCKWILFKI